LLEEGASAEAVRPGREPAQDGSKADEPSDGKNCGGTRRLGALGHAARHAHHRRTAKQLFCLEIFHLK